jgi:hypothetical protein
MTGAHELYFDKRVLFLPGLAAAAVLFVFLMLIVRTLLGGSSRGHRIIWESAVVLLIGLPVTGVMLVSDINTAADRSPPRITELRVVDQRISVGRRSKGGKSYKYYLRVTPLAPTTSAANSSGTTNPLAATPTTNTLTTTLPPELKVRKSFYQIATPGRTIRLIERSGALGYPWVESLELAP